MSDSPARSISRRSIAKGVAWAAPAIVLAGAAPAFAASPILIGEVGAACKYPGNSHGGNCKQAYRFDTKWTNLSMTESVNVTFSVVWTNTNLGTATSLLVDGVVYLGGSVLVTPGDHDIIIVASEGSSANSAGTVEVTASYTYNGNDYAQKITKTFTTTPPNCPDGCITGG